MRILTKILLVSALFTLSLFAATINETNTVNFSGGVTVTNGFTMKDVSGPVATPTVGSSLYSSNGEMYVVNTNGTIIKIGTGGGGSSTSWRYWTNDISMVNQNTNYLYPLNTNVCNIPHIYTWAKNTNNVDFSGTIWTWGRNNYTVDENVNRFSVRYQVTDMTNTGFTSTNILWVRNGASFNNDDIVALFPHGAATDPTEFALVTNRNGSALYLRHNITGNYTSTSGRVHRVVRFDGMDRYLNVDGSNAMPISLEFTVAITNTIVVKMMEVDN